MNGHERLTPVMTVTASQRVEATEDLVNMTEGNYRTDDEQHQQYQALNSLVHFTF